jgi:hypothetical protein
VCHVHTDNPTVTCWAKRHVPDKRCKTEGHFANGTQSWNVYNSANIARVKADEAAAAAREDAEDQRMQEIDAARRAAILRGQTPPPLPEDEAKDTSKSRRREGPERKRRKLAGEDDTDMDIRLATSTAPKDDEQDARILKLRRPALDAPLTDQAGNINLFPVDHKEAVERQKNEEAEKEKKKKQMSFEDQYTVRLSNAAGRGGLKDPWYASGGYDTAGLETNAGEKALEYPHLESKDVWGNEDPRRQEREKTRVISNDPFSFMQKAQVQLKKSKEDRKKWMDERERELWELRAAQERESRRERRGKRKKRAEDDDETRQGSRKREESRSSKRKHRHRSRSRSATRRNRHGSSHGSEPKGSGSREGDYEKRRSSDRDYLRRREHSS